MNQVMQIRSSIELAVTKAWAKRNNLSIWSILRIFRQFKTDAMPPSLFKPWVASWIYDKVIPHGGLVLDPCAGWAGRMLGTIGRQIRYVGRDINQQTIDGCKSIAKICKFCLGDVDLKACNVKDLHYNGHPNLILTSPPYLDTESYNGSPKGNWDVIKNICSLSNNLGTPNLVLNVSNWMKSKTIKIMESSGYNIKEIFPLQTYSYARNKVTEPIIWAVK